MKNFLKRIAKVFCEPRSTTLEASSVFVGPNAKNYKGDARRAYDQGFKDGYLQGMLKQQSLYQ